MTKAAVFGRIGISAIAGLTGVLLARIFAPSLMAKFSATPWFVPVMELATLIIVMAAVFGLASWRTEVEANESGMRGRKAFIGLLVGMGCGTGVAWLLGRSPVLGLEMGMFIGVASGICVDKDQPTRTRIALAIFAIAVGIAALYVLTK